MGERSYALAPTVDIGAHLPFEPGGGVMFTCKCCPDEAYRHRVWHRLYIAWYDHDHAGHRVRAAVIGRIADAYARIIWP